VSGEGQRILGVDPGIGTTGWAMVVENSGRFRLAGSGCIRPRRAVTVGERLHDIQAGIVKVCRKFDPQEISLEESFYGKNVKVALTIGQARAAVLLAAVEAGIPVFEYSARLVKQAVTGRGQAVKQQVGFMVQNLLRLPAPLTPVDTADAAAIAICHLLRRKSPAAIR
jgi:crossover junction endodeoxyribonuclease RuvC